MEQDLQLSHDYIENPAFDDEGNLGQLLESLKAAVQDMQDFILPDQMFYDGVKSACDFFRIPYPRAVIPNDSTCVYPNNPSVYEDDVIGYSREELINMGIYRADAVHLIMTHECVHHIFQNSPTFGSWEHELASDYHAGVRAALGQLDTTHFEQSLENTLPSPTHPGGDMRVDIIRYGKETALRYLEEGIVPTFENCLDGYYRYIADHAAEMQPPVEAASAPVSGFTKERSLEESVSFTGKYSEAEIRRLEEDLKKREYEVNNLKSKVRHHENLVSLTKKNSPDYAHEVSKLNRVKSEYNDAVSRHSAARSRYNNAR